jgi:hypothetical protein
MFLSLVIAFSAFILVLAQNNPSPSSNNAIDSSAITYLDNTPCQNNDIRESCVGSSPQHNPDFVARSEGVWYHADAPDEPLVGQAAVNYEEMVQTFEYSEMVWHSVEDFARERGWGEGGEGGFGI